MNKNNNYSVNQLLILDALIKKEGIRGVDISGLHKSFQEDLDDRLFKYLRENTADVSLIVERMSRRGDLIDIMEKSVTVARPKISKIVYELPIEEMPLYMKEPILDTFATWRLKINH